jgi:hypothetical protein
MESLNWSAPSGCTGDVTRRDVLPLAAGLGLSFLVPGLELRAARSRGAERPKSLIILWMDGGQSQLESWDPHPGTKIGGDTKAVRTRLPGVEIAAFLPRMAEQLHEMCLIRSMFSKEQDHMRGSYLLKTGYRPDPSLLHPSLGSIVVHETPSAGVDIPRYVSILNSFFPVRAGYLGDSYDALRIHDPRQKLQNMAARVETDRLDRRLAHLDVIEDAFRRERQVQVDDTRHRDMMQRALTMMTSDQLRAFRVDKEPAEVREAYGNTQFGAGCLVARRLVEVGVRTVEINLEGFDSHSNNRERQQKNASILDPAFAALIHDLKQRDLFESTVVLCVGEFGRTPKINAEAGRDHWSTGFSCVVGGGGFRSGLVIGETDSSGEKTDPADPIQVHDLFATILHALGIEYDKVMITPIGRPMALCKGQPIERLLA